MVEVRVNRSLSLSLSLSGVYLSTSIQALWEHYIKVCLDFFVSKWKQNENIHHFNLKSTLIEKTDRKAVCVLDKLNRPEPVVDQYMMCTVYDLISKVLGVLILHCMEGEISFLCVRQGQVIH